jgi:ABC-type multidrug transport system fused ATPase/permease subunit
MQDLRGLCWGWWQVVALVGPSGGGKSSIVKLVERFYLPDSGAVLLDGRDVGLYDARWLKRRVALVAQVCAS